MVYTACMEEISGLFIATIKLQSLIKNFSARSVCSLNQAVQEMKISIEHCSALGMPQ